MLKFERLNKNHLERVLKWRTDPEISRFMITDIDFDLTQQQLWFEKIQNDSNSRYWVISYSGQNIGVINLAEINLLHRRCSWGFYVGEKEFRPLGVFIPPYLYNYVFQVMGLHKITGEVMEGNSNILKIHELQGCRLVGTQKDQIFKYGKFHDLHLVELLASDWEKQKGKYGKYVAPFD